MHGNGILLTFEKVYSMIPLTPRENQVLNMILEEKTSSSIAKELGISERTVETYRKSIYAKTGVRTVVGLVKKYWFKGRKEH